MADVIVPGDTLAVNIHTGDDTTAPQQVKLLVADDGTVNPPYMGTVQVAGLDISNAAITLQNASIERRVYMRPSILVNFDSRFKNRITVVGAVANPQQYLLAPNESNLSAALIAAGGFTDLASSRIEIRQAAGFLPQTNSQTGVIDMRSSSDSLVVIDLENENGPPADLPLVDGALVTVVERPEQYITVIGQTGNKTIKMTPQRELRMLDAIAEAGGLKYSEWISDEVKVIRQVADQDESVTIKLSVRKAKRNRTENLRLAAGDVVSVEENLLTFTLGTLGQLIGVGARAATLP